MNEHVNERVVVANSRATYSEGYIPGFGNDFETEALPCALPIGQNSPQRCSYGLYAEQLSGTPFTAPCGTNKRSWLYRMRPTVQHLAAAERVELPLFRSVPTVGENTPPLTPLRWDPSPIPNEALTFIADIRTIATGGDVHAQAGYAIHTYSVTKSMTDDCFYIADGELLIVPQAGALRFFNEFGIVDIAPGEIAVIPRSRPSVLSCHLSTIRLHHGFP